MNAMVLLPYPSFYVRANSSSSIPFDLIPIALIRDPRSIPDIPIILFKFPAFPMISLHVRVVLTLDTPERRQDCE